MTGRDQAVPVYSALRDAGSAGLTRDELLAAAWLPVSTNVGEIVAWIRMHGVDIRYRSGPELEGRFFLVTALPGPWDETVR